MEPLDDTNELKRMAPTLHAVPRKDPFLVPDSFFEHFPHQVQAAITRQDQRSSRTWSPWKRLALAFPVLALLGLGIWWITRPPAVIADAAMAIVPLSDEELDLMDEEDVLAALDGSAATSTSTTDLGQVDLQLNDDELLTYLETEGADLTDLIIELE